MKRTLDQQNLAFFATFLNRIKSTSSLHKILQPLWILE